MLISYPKRAREETRLIQLRMMRTEERDNEWRLLKQKGVSRREQSGVLADDFHAYIPMRASNSGLSIDIAC